MNLGYSVFLDAFFKKIKSMEQKALEYTENWLCENEYKCPYQKANHFIPQTVLFIIFFLAYFGLAPLWLSIGMEVEGI